MLLRQIRCFVAVARTGSFSAAAEAMNLSQPSLGVHVRNLEERYKVQLFHRHARGATPTAAGHALIKSAESLLAEADGIEDFMRTIGRSTPRTVTLGMTPTAEATLAPDLIQRSMLEHPQLSLTVVQGLSDDLRRRTEIGKIDAALLYGATTGEQSGLLPLYTEDLYLVGQPASLGPKRSIRFQELARYKLTLDRRFQALRRLIDETAAAQGVSLIVEREVEPVEVKRALINRHGCFAIVPYGLYLDEVKLGRMGARRIVAPKLQRTMYLLLRKQLPPSLAGLLTGWIQDAVGSAVASTELRWRRT